MNHEQKRDVLNRLISGTKEERRQAKRQLLAPDLSNARIHWIITVTDDISTPTASDKDFIIRRAPDGSLRYAQEPAARENQMRFWSQHPWPGVNYDGKPIFEVQPNERWSSEYNREKTEHGEV